LQKVENRHPLKSLEAENPKETFTIITADLTLFTESEPVET
jgi:hypothetical protein